MSISSPNYSPKDSGEWFTWIARRLRILERHTHSPIAEKRMAAQGSATTPFTTATKSLLACDGLAVDGDSTWGIRLSWAGVGSSVAGDIVAMEIRRGGYGGTVVGAARVHIPVTGTPIGGGMFEVTDQPAAGTYVYAGTCTRVSGTGSITVYADMTMVVERVK